MMKVSPLKIKKYISQSLHNQQLRQAVDKATDSSLITRQKVVDQIPYWEELRFKTHAIKKEVIENLADYSKKIV